ARRAEFTVRQALGAGKTRLAGQLVTEGLILATFGTALGLAIAYLSRNALGLFFPPRGGTTLVFAADFNARVLATTIGIGLALSRSLPFSTRPYDNGPILVDGYVTARDEQPTADVNAVTPGYFRTLEIPLLSGRDFAASEADTSAPVAIVTRAMSERYWPNA